MRWTFLVTTCMGVAWGVKWQISGLFMYLSFCIQHTCWKRYHASSRPDSLFSHLGPWLLLPLTFHKTYEPHPLGHIPTCISRATKRPPLTHSDPVLPALMHLWISRTFCIFLAKVLVSMRVRIVTVDISYFFYLTASYLRTSTFY